MTRARNERLVHLPRNSGRALALGKQCGAGLQQHRRGDGVGNPRRTMAAAVSPVPASAGSGAMPRSASADNAAPIFHGAYRRLSIEAMGSASVIVQGGAARLAAGMSAAMPDPSVIILPAVVAASHNGLTASD
jgi:hypothetical protein